MRLKLCYNASTKEVEILEHDPGQAYVKVENINEDEVILVVSTTEEEHGSIYEHTIGEL